MNDDQINTIEVTIDKSHIVTIGERLYSESIELIRELVNNAYDADAEVVKVFIAEDSIVVEDDGLGMDLDGLKQYFAIGSAMKKNNPKSPRFGRDRIGEFGIGKFASLSACSCFEVLTKKGDFLAQVVFDKQKWEQSGDKWHLPLEINPADQHLKDGTKITLRGLKRKFDTAEVEKRIIETVPLKAPNFAVYLNSRKINPKFIAGHRIPFLEGTEYGIIHGEIVITSQLDQDISEAGIECKVKQVTITRDFFGLEGCISNIARIKGEVNADFLPITSDRTGFLKDTPQYQNFIEVMGRVIERAKPILDELADYKENKRVRSTLNEVLEKVKEALVLNPDFCPEGLLPLADAASESGQPGYIAPQPLAQGETVSGGTVQEGKERKKRKRKPQVKRLTSTAVIKKMKFGQQGVNCCVDHFGQDGQECSTEGAIIFINRDHPLYKKEALRKDTFILHIARLLTQEICLMKDPRNPRQAFLRQSKLMRDALVKETQNIPSVKTKPQEQ